MALEDALNSLLGDKQTGNRREDQIAAGREMMRRREQNTIDGAEVINSLLEDGLSYREIENLIGVPRSTAQRWSTPPGQA